MAVTQGKSPLIFTALGDAIGDDGRQWCITCIAVRTTSTSGVFELLDKAGGRTIFRSKAVNADDGDELHFDGHWFDGLYVEQLPADGVIYAYYK